MQYTLDSVTQFMNALKEENKNTTVDYTAVFYSDLTKLVKSNDTYFFGIITLGSNVVKMNLLNENDAKIIEIATNSQIIEAFSSVQFKDGADADVLAPEGQFRGFIVTVT